jgi:hypothetical protein
MRAFFLANLELDLTVQSRHRMGTLIARYIFLVAFRNE